MKINNDMENKWVANQYCTTKICIGGLVVASIAWAITGKSGYVLTINNIVFKAHFETIDDAKIVADNFISEKVDKYLQLTKKIGLKHK